MTFTEYIELLQQEIREAAQNIHTELTAMGFSEEIKEAKAVLTSIWSNHAMSSV